MTENVKEEIERLENQIKESRTLLRELRNKEYHIENVENYSFSLLNNEKINLENLFGDNEDLMLIHNMGQSCPYCTLWADGFNGMLRHLENRAAFVVSSPDTPEAQDSIAKKRNWNFKMVSTQGTSFIADMGMENDKEQPWPGVSFFHKDSDGKITRVSKDFFGPGDDYCSLWHLIENFKEGSKGWQAKHEY
jgi:predicted dithiol-disulfide oxidoreductase (DUF899 family)